MKKIIFEELFINKAGIEDKRVVLRAFNSDDPIQQSTNIAFIENESDVILPDEYFREAWILDKKTKKLGINKEKAINIHIDKLRVKRNEALKKLDIETTIATQQKDNTKLDKIAEKAQKLRDMPETAKLELEALDDFEAIKNYIPEGSE